VRQPLADCAPIDPTPLPPPALLASFAQLTPRTHAPILTHYGLAAVSSHLLSCALADYATRMAWSSPTSTPTMARTQSRPGQQSRGAGSPRSSGDAKGEKGTTIEEEPYRTFYEAFRRDGPDGDGVCKGKGPCLLHMHMYRKRSVPSNTIGVFRQPPTVTITPSRRPGATNFPSGKQCSSASAVLVQFLVDP